MEEGFGDLDDNEIGEEIDEDIGDFWFIIDIIYVTFVKDYFLKLKTKNFKIYFLKFQNQEFLIYHFFTNNLV